MKESLEPTQDNEIRQELQFYHELPEAQQMLSELRTPIEEIGRRKEWKQAREAQERYLAEQLNLSMPNSRGQAGKKNDAESSQSSKAPAKPKGPKAPAPPPKVDDAIYGSPDLGLGEQIEGCGCQAYFCEKVG